MTRKPTGAALVAAEYNVTMLDVMTAYGLTRQALQQMHNKYPHRFRIICAGVGVLISK